MMRDDSHRGLRILFGLASVVVVIAGMKAAQDLLLPLLSAAFLSILCIPPMRRLQRHGITPTWSMLMVVAGATLVVIFVTALVGSSIADFQDELPNYQGKLKVILTDAGMWLDGHGFKLKPEQFAKRILDSGKIMELVGDTAMQLLAAASNIFLVVLMMLFMLIEANGFSTKLRAAIGNDAADLTEYSRAAHAVYDYISYKTIVSLLTGMLVTIANAALGVDFPLLWGLLAFLFNFVPNIGSVIAAIPAVLIAFLDQGVMIGSISAVSYTVINTLIGNVIEPKIFGERLGLSPLIVFLSLVFWGWVWGPLGMLMSVPLTVIIKILLEHSDDFHGLSMLLGPTETARKKIRARTLEPTDDP